MAELITELGTGETPGFRTRQRVRDSERIPPTRRHSYGGSSKSGGSEQDGRGAKE